MDKYLDEQLARLRTDVIDFYLVHGLMRPFWENLVSLGVTDFLTEAIADGRIRYPGFSFHDNTKVFKEIVKGYDWTFAQIQYNFMDEHYQAGTEGLDMLQRRGLASWSWNRSGAAFWQRTCRVSRRSGRGQRPIPACRVGAPLGLEPPGGDGRPLRHVDTGAGQAEC